MPLFRVDIKLELCLHWWRTKNSRKSDAKCRKSKKTKTKREPKRTTKAVAERLSQWKFDNSFDQTILVFWIPTPIQPSGFHRFHSLHWTYIYTRRFTPILSQPAHRGKRIPNPTPSIKPFSSLCQSCFDLKR